MKIPQPNPSKNPAESQTITSAIYIRVSATKHAEKQLSKLRGFASCSRSALTGSGFDTFLIEGYQYPESDHNLDQATWCAQYSWNFGAPPCQYR